MCVYAFVCGGGSCTAGAAALSSTHLVCLGLSRLVNGAPLLPKAPTKAQHQDGASGESEGGTGSEFSLPAWVSRSPVLGPRSAIRSQLWCQRESLETGGGGVGGALTLEGG